MDPTAMAEGSRGCLTASFPDGSCVRKGPGSSCVAVLRDGTIARDGGTGKYVSFDSTEAAAAHLADAGEGPYSIGCVNTGLGLGQSLQVRLLCSLPHSLKAGRAMWHRRSSRGTALTPRLSEAGLYDAGAIPAFGAEGNKEIAILPARVVLGHFPASLDEDCSWMAALPLLVHADNWEDFAPAVRIRSLAVAMRDRGFWMCNNMTFVWDKIGDAALALGDVMRPAARVADEPRRWSEYAERLDRAIRDEMGSVEAPGPGPEAYRGYEVLVAPADGPGALWVGVERAANDRPARATKACTSLARLLDEIDGDARPTSGNYEAFMTITGGGIGHRACTRAEIDSLRATLAGPA